MILKIVDTKRRKWNKQIFLKQEKCGQKYIVGFCFSFDLSLFFAFLFSEGSHVSDDVTAFLFGLHAGEGHLGAGDELFGVFEVLEEVFFGPDDTGVLVGVGVGVAFDGTGLAVDDTPEVGADTVGTTLGGSVALTSAGLEELFSLLDVTFTHDV